MLGKASFLLADSTRVPVWIIFVCLAFLLSACSDDPRTEYREIRGQIQRAYGANDFKKGAELAEQGLSLARNTLGDSSEHALYFVQAVSANRIALGDTHNSIAALKREISMRAAAGQAENRLQSRRTLLIQLAEENGDLLAAADQAIAVSRGINMSIEKDPQPVYRSGTTYPPALYQQRIEGDVEILYSLDEGGAVTDALVVRSTPTTVFDQAALESFRKWRFTPMLNANSQPVPLSGRTFTVAFRLGR